LLVLFDLLGEKIEFTPGQYFFVTLLAINGDTLARGDEAL